jgi:hypothetical protein
VSVLSQQTILLSAKATDRFGNAIVTASPKWTVLSGPGVFVADGALTVTGGGAITVQARLVDATGLATLTGVEPPRGISSEVVAGSVTGMTASQLAIASIRVPGGGTAKPDAAGRYSISIPTSELSFPELKLERLTVGYSVLLPAPNAPLRAFSQALSQREPNITPSTTASALIAMHPIWANAPPAVMADLLARIPRTAAYGTLVQQIERQWNASTLSIDDSAIKQALRSIYLELTASASFSQVLNRTALFQPCDGGLYNAGEGYVRLLNDSATPGDLKVCNAGARSVDVWVDPVVVGSAFSSRRVAVVREADYTLNTFSVDSWLSFGKNLFGIDDNAFGAGEPKSLGVQFSRASPIWSFSVYGPGAKSAPPSNDEDRRRYGVSLIRNTVSRLVIPLLVEGFKNFTAISPKDWPGIDDPAVIRVVEEKFVTAALDRVLKTFACGIGPSSSFSATECMASIWLEFTNTMDAATLRSALLIFVPTSDNNVYVSVIDGVIEKASIHAKIASAVEKVTDATLFGWTVLRSPPMFRQELSFNDLLLVDHFASIPAGGALGTRLAGSRQRVKVKAIRANGEAVPGAWVEWQIDAGGGRIENAELTTGTDGTASADWVLGEVAGPARVIARTPGRTLGTVIQASVVEPNFTLIRSGGDGQLGLAGQALGEAVRVRVTVAGQPIEGVPVNFTATAGGGGISTEKAQTDLNGEAAAVWTLGSTGRQLVEARLAGAQGSPVIFEAFLASSLRIDMDAGGGQTGVVGATLPNPIVVRVRESVSLLPVSGARVQFTPNLGGSVSRSVGATSIDGRASTSWMLGGAAGTQILQASLFGGGGTATVTATARPGPAARLVLAAGDGQIGQPLSVLGGPLRVRVSDTQGNGVPGFQIGWSILSGGGSFSPSGLVQLFSQSDAEGYSEVQWRLGAGSGAKNNSVSASAASLAGSPVIFSASGLNGALLALSVLPNPVTLIRGGTQQLSPQPTLVAGGTASYRYSTSAPAVATVSVGGLVQAVGVGTASITVTGTGIAPGATTNEIAVSIPVTVSLSGPSGLGIGFGAEQFADISGGLFQMGAPNGLSDQAPVHTVTLSAFKLQKTEVTQSQWRQVMSGLSNANPSAFSNCGDTCPVERVSWNDIQTFLTRLNQQDPGKNYRLPTEAEWEYAARAGTTGDYGGSGNLDEMGWWSGNSQNKTWPVAQKRANAWGLYDMHGNVWEWTADWYGPYVAGPQTNPTGPTAGTYRVNRGGSCDDPATSARSAYRNYSLPTLNTDQCLGFRLAMGALPGSASVTVGVGSGTTGSGTVSWNNGLSCAITSSGATGACSGTFPVGALISFTATPAAGSVFGGWSGSCSGAGTSPTCSLGMNFPGAAYDPAAKFTTSAAVAPVLRLPFDGNANDVSGNALNGTPTNVTAISDRNGAANGAYQFNGSSSEVVVNDSPLLRFSTTTPFTVSAWVKVRVVNKDQVVLAKYSNTTGSLVYLLSFAQGKPTFLVQKQGSGAASAQSTTVVTADRWYHVVGTFDGSTQRLYVDGALAATQPYTSGAASGDATMPFRIGNQRATDVYWWDGAIDDVRVYSGALSATQVSNLFSTGQP